MTRTRHAATESIAGARAARAGERISTMESDRTGLVDYPKGNPVEVPKTQYELPGVTEEGPADVPVAVFPLWHAVVTAKIAFPTGAQAALVSAQKAACGSARGGVTSRTRDECPGLRRSRSRS